MDDTQAAFYATAQCTPDRSSTASFAHALITPAIDHCITRSITVTQTVLRPPHKRANQHTHTHARRLVRTPQRVRHVERERSSLSSSTTWLEYGRCACLHRMPVSSTPDATPTPLRGKVRDRPQLGRGWAWSLFEGVGEEDRDQVGIDLVKEHEAARLAEDTPRSTRPQARHASLANDRLDAL